jgi:hypothetical protein
MRGQRLMLGPEKTLVEIIDNNLDELCQSWMRIVRNEKMTRSYQVFDQELVYQRIRRCYEHLARWLSGDFTKGDIASTYTAEGAKRRREGFKLAEVIRAFLVARRVLWFKVQEEGFVSPDMSGELAMLVNNRVLVFFDRALYYMTVGYERE